MAELPYMQFFPADYLRDTEILSLSAQGGWMRMLCSMWHPSRRGVLSLRLQAMARLLHASEQTTKSIIEEIQECGVADVEWGGHGEAIDQGADARVTITCRRMVRDWEKASGEKQMLVDAGKRGAAKRWGNRGADSPPNGRPNSPPTNPANGNPEARSQSSKLPSKTPASEPPPPSAIPTLDEVKRYAVSAPVPISAECAVAFHDTQQAEGWITRNGHPIADWRAALRRYASRWNELEKSKGSAPSMPGQPRQRVASGYGESTDISNL